MIEKLKGLKGILFRVDSRTIYLYAFFTGVLTGGVALLFHFAIHGLSHLLFDDLAHFPLPEASPTTFAYIILAKRRRERELTSF